MAYLYNEQGSVYIIGGARTPTLIFKGPLSYISSNHLGVFAFTEALRKTHIDASEVEALYCGQVYDAGDGQNVAHTIALRSDCKEDIDTEVIKKVCASSLAAAQRGYSAIRLDGYHCVGVCGMESMSNVPYLLRRPKRKTPAEKPLVGDIFVLKMEQHYDDFKNTKLIDGLSDGLRDGVTSYWMGEIGDEFSKKHGISREEQDDYAYESYVRAGNAKDILRKHFVVIPPFEGVYDQGWREPDREKMRTLNPAFSGGGVLTSANSSQLADGAAAMILISEMKRKEIDDNSSFPVYSRIIRFENFTGHPHEFLSAPVYAVKRLLAKAELDLSEIDQIECNEAFSAVPLYFMRETGFPHEKMNAWGGAIANGHPLGASGVKITLSLLYRLQETGGKFGVAVLCYGGGGALAMLVRNMRA